MPIVLRDNGRFLNQGLRGSRDEARRLLAGGLDRRQVIATFEQPLQKAAPRTGFGPVQRGQRTPLQPTEFPQQRRQIARLGYTGLQPLGKLLQRPGDIAGQRQALQLINQCRQRIAHLVHAGFAALLRLQYRFFKTGDKAGKPGIHVVTANDLAHFLHALVDDLVAALSG